MNSAPIFSIKDKSAIQRAAAKPPHALLIVAESGLDGIGAAESIAQASASAEILRLQPLPKKTIISTEQIRDLTAALRTHTTTRRMIIIHPADSLTEPAQNALLKSLEEPGANTHFLLVAATAESLLATIRSRCQTLTLHRTSPAQDRAILTPQNLDPKTTQQILFLAAGRPLLIRSLMRNPKQLAEYQSLATDAKLILSQPRSYAALTAALKHTDREQALRLVEILLRFIRFQLQSGAATADLRHLADQLIDTENSLNANANVRLALLKIVL